MNLGSTPATGSPKDQALRFLRRAVDYRRQFDQRRAIFYRQYVGQRDAQKFPDNTTNRANTFVPYPLSNVETIVSRVDDAFFSFYPWFEVSGVTETDDKAADAMQLILDKKLMQASFKPAFEDLVRNISIYGFGALKVDWNWDFKTLTKPVPTLAMANGQPVVDPNTGQPVVIGYHPQTFQVPACCPLIKAIDIYDTVIDPDGSIVACLTERTLGDITRSCQAYKMATGQDYFYPEALAELTSYITMACPENPDAVLVRYAEVWDADETSCTLVTFGEDKDAIAWKDLRASYRATAYSPYKRKLYDGPPILLWTGPNQFDHKRNPILYTSYIKLPNELYGIGAIETITDLTESMNKFVNMVTDNWNMAINRRYAYDTNADIDHEQLNQANVPGGKVGVNGDPSKVLVPLPFFTPNQGDYAILDLYKGMIEMGSGISDFYGKAVGNPTGNKTATGINSVINESNYRFKLFIRNLELDILQPMLMMCASMVQQYMSDKEEVLLTKSQMGPQVPKWQVIDPQAIIGNYEFDLTAANYATNKTVRQRNLMAFAQVAQSTPYWRAGEGLREIGKVLEIRNINDLIKSEQEVQMEQQQAQQQQRQEAFVEKVIDTESAIAVADAGAKFKARTQAGKAGDKNPNRPKSPHPEGRPAKEPHNRAVPGVSEESGVREFAQNMGANALGLSGGGV